MSIGKLKSDHGIYFMRLTALTIIALLSLSACSTSQSKSVSRQITTTSDFSTGTLTWCSPPARCGVTGSYLFRWKPIVKDGQIEICGIGRIRNTRLLPAKRKAMRMARVEYQGQTILTNLNFFYDAGIKTDLVGRPSNCQQTGIEAVGSEFNVQLIVPASTSPFHW